MREEEGRNEPAPRAHVNGAGTAFEKAYADLKASSELLVKTEDNLVGVYETRGVLLTVIDFQEHAIGTMRLEGDPDHYEQIKAALRVVC